MHESTVVVDETEDWRLRPRQPRPLGDRQRWPPPTQRRSSSRKRKRPPLQPEPLAEESQEDDTTYSSSPITSRIPRPIHRNDAGSHHKISGKSPEIPEANPEDNSEDGDKARISRLFYLQLYSSVLNAERQAVEERLQNRNQQTETQNSHKASKLSFPRVKILKSPKSTITTSAHQENYSEEICERDVGESLHAVAVERATILPLEDQVNNINNSLEFAPTTTATTSVVSSLTQKRTLPVPSNKEPAPLPPPPTSPPPLNPLASFRQRAYNNLSETSAAFGSVFRTRHKSRISTKYFPQFSFRRNSNNNRSNPARIINPSAILSSRSSCRVGRSAVSTLIASLLALIFLVIFVVIISSPESYTSYYEEIFTLDQEPSIGPKVVLCIPMPFAVEKLKNFGVGTKLASFLLYSLSPFLPNADILDHPDILADLTNEYRLLTARMSDRRRRQPVVKSGLKKILKSLAPNCSDIIIGCRTGSRNYLSGEDCCHHILTKTEYSPDGICWSGEFSRLSREPVFPVATPGTLSSITFFINVTNQATGDQRIISVDPMKSKFMTAATLHPREELAYRNSRNDVTLPRGQVVSINILKRLMDNSGPSAKLSGKCVTSSSEGVTSPSSMSSSLYHRRGCRSSVIQMISEKSLNCSMISMPPVNPNLPPCGPLEGLALMYILREQGALVTSNTTVSNRFEETLMDHCPPECQLSYFEPIVSSLNPMDEEALGQINQKSNNFRDPMSMIEFQYRIEEFVRTKRYRSGVFMLLVRLGALAGLAIVSIAAFLGLKHLCLNSGTHFLFKKK